VPRPDKLIFNCPNAWQMDLTVDRSEALLEASSCNLTIEVLIVVDEKFSRVASEGARSSRCWVLTRLKG